MSFLSDCCHESLNSELDLFSVEPTQTSIDSGSWIEYNPISALQHGTGIEFVIQGTGTDYIDIAKTRLYVKARILQNDDTPIDNTHAVAPVNLTLSSIFSELDIKMNGTTISNTNSMYAYRAYLETLLSYDVSAKESQLTAELFYKDTPGAFEDDNPLDGAGLNVGLKKRHSLFNNGAEVEMIGPLHADLFQQERLIPSDIGLKIKLLRSKDAFCLMSNAGGDAFKLSITECTLFVRKVKLNSSVFLAHAKALQVNNMRFPIKRTEVKTFTVSAGSMSHTQEAVFSGQLPTRVVIGFVDNRSFNGMLSRNPFNFQHFNVNHIKITVDGSHDEGRTFSTSFNPVRSEYISAYLSLFEITGQYRKNRGLDISRDGYINGNFLVTHDMTPDLSAGRGLNLIHDGSLRLQLGWRNALPNTINVIILADFDALIEVDRQKQVLYEHAN